METMQIMAQKENIKHGSSQFPLACYVYEGAKFSKKFASHWHPEVEIICFEQGSYVMNIQSEPVTIEAPAILVIPSKLVHSIYFPGNAKERAIVFNPEIVRFAFYDQTQNTIFDNLYDNTKNNIALLKSSSSYYQSVLESFNFIFERFQTKDNNERLILKLRLMTMLSLLNTSGIFHSVDIPSEFEQGRQKKLKELIEWIQDHHSGPLAVADAANRMNFSEAYFCRFFKKATKMSFTEYVNDYRLRQAADDILVASKPISEIAADHGFDNESYFFRLFKKKFGITPLKYRAE